VHHNFAVSHSPKPKFSRSVHLLAYLLDPGRGRTRRRGTALAHLVNATDSVQAWQDTPLANKQLIIDRLMTVTILLIGRGFDPVVGTRRPQTPPGHPTSHHDQLTHTPSVPIIGGASSTEAVHRPRGGDCGLGRCHSAAIVWRCSSVGSGQVSTFAVTSAISA
jgi:hypothetical protein